MLAANENIFNALDGASARRRNLFNGGASLFFFSVWFINFSSTPINNINNTLLQICFVMAVIACLKLPAHFGLVTVLALFFSGSLVLSSLLMQAADFSMVAWLRAAECITAVLFGFALYRWFFVESKAAWYLSGATALAVYGYFSLLIFYGLSLDDPAHHDWVSASPLFPNIRHLGHYLCVGMVCMAWAALASTGRWAWFFLSAFLLATSLMMWSGGRGASLAALLGISLLLPAFPWRKNRKRWSALLACMPLALLLSEWFVAGTGDAMGWLSAWHNSAESRSLEALSSGRLSIWSDVAHHIAQRPWLGWGGEAFFRLDIRHGMLHAHNGPLQLLLEWGFIGAIGISSLIACVVFTGGYQYWLACRCEVPRHPLQGMAHGLAQSMALGLALTGALLVLSLVDGVFYFSGTMAFLAAGCGMVVAAEHAFAHKPV